MQALLRRLPLQPRIGQAAPALRMHQHTHLGQPLTEYRGVAVVDGYLRDGGLRGNWYTKIVKVS